MLPNKIISSVYSYLESAVKDLFEDKLVIDKYRIKDCIHSIGENFDADYIKLNKLDKKGNDFLQKCIINNNLLDLTSDEFEVLIKKSNLKRRNDKGLDALDLFLMHYNQKHIFLKPHVIDYLIDNSEKFLLKRITAQCTLLTTEQKFKIKFPYFYSFVQMFSQKEVEHKFQKIDVTEIIKDKMKNIEPSSMNILYKKELTQVQNIILTLEKLDHNIVDKKDYKATFLELIEKSEKAAMIKEHSGQTIELLPLIELLKEQVVEDIANISHTENKEVKAIHKYLQNRK